MKSALFTASVVLGAAALAADCSGNPLVVGREIDAGRTSACAAVSGTCAPVTVACASEAPASVQDCNTTDNRTGPGGDRCCLTFADAGPGRDAEVADAGSGNHDGGNNDGAGASACASAGGQCVQGNVACANTAPTGAQDCSTPPVTGGTFCCLTAPDAGPGRDGAAEGGPLSDDGGGNDGGLASACAAAGGTCIDASMMCAKNAPFTAQDCTPSPAGSFCCITPL